MPTSSSQGLRFRIRSGQRLALVAFVVNLGGTLEGTFLVEFDDGTFDNLLLAPQSLANFGLVSATSNPAAKNGWIVQGYLLSNGASNLPGAVQAYAYIIDGAQALVQNIRQAICSGYPTQNPNGQVFLGSFEPIDFAGTWVVQGTVAEDATAGTHITTLTVSPQAGNALEIVAGMILVGNTATAQTASAVVTDGTHQLAFLAYTPANTNASANYSFPSPQSGIGTASVIPASTPRLFVSGTMKIILQVQTTAVSVTQTFSLICRLKGISLPSVTLADTVGSPTLTVNTNSLF